MKVVWKDSAGKTKVVSAGFSYTVVFSGGLLLGGAIVPLYRKHWRWAGLLAGLSILTNVPFLLDLDKWVLAGFAHLPKVTAFVVDLLWIQIVGFLWVYVSAKYNRIYAKHLIRNGHKAVQVIGGTFKELEAKWGMEIPKADSRKGVNKYVPNLKAEGGGASRAFYGFVIAVVVLEGAISYMAASYEPQTWKSQGVSREAVKQREPQSGMDVYVSQGGVNERDALGSTALMRAASSGNAEAIRELVKAGADKRARDFFSFTAFDYWQKKYKDHPNYWTILKLLRP